MEGAIGTQVNHVCVPSAPPLFPHSTFVMNRNILEQNPSPGAHETTHRLSNTANLNTCVLKETDTSVCSGSTTVIETNEISPSPEFPVRTHTGMEVNAHVVPSLIQLSVCNARELGTWGAAISYEAGVRVCLHAWANNYSSEVQCFLENECALLRYTFGLQNVLLQSEAELLAKGSSKLSSEAAAQNPVKTSGKIKLQVRKVMMILDESPSSCSLSSLKQPKINKDAICRRVSKSNSSFFPWLKYVWKKYLPPHAPKGTFRQSLDHVKTRAKHIEKVPRLLKAATSTLCNPSSSSQETYSCFLRLRSSTEEDAIRMQPGSGEAHFFFPDSLGDDLIIAVQDSKGQHCGHARAQVSAIADKPDDKLRWWPLYTDLELEPVGKIQLCMEYSTNPDENHHLKSGSIAETVAYDYVFVAAVKFQDFQQRSFLIDGPWKWLLTEFASYFGISEAYTKLRHLSYVMDVATPTKDCLTIVHDMLSDIFSMKGKSTNQLSPLENHMLVKILDQVNQTLALVFENYKSLEEDSPSGMTNVFKPASGLVPPSLVPAIQLYSLLHDVLSPEAQMKLCRYFRVAAKKRLRGHFVETDNLFLSSNEGIHKDPITSYQKMNSLISSIRNEILTDISIQNQNILPCFVDLPNISSSIYNVELCSRLCAFLVACPPPGLSPPVAELIIATAEFQRDLSLWNITPVVGGVDAKDLFHSHIVSWIRDKHRTLLDRCQLDKIYYYLQNRTSENWSDKETKNETNPFIHVIYNQLMETLNEYEIISSHLPMYAPALENAVADVEMAVAKTMEECYSNVLSPLKDNLSNKVLGNKYVKILSNQTIETYSVLAEVGIVFNSMKCMLDVMWPNIEAKFQSWLPCIDDDGYTRGEHLNDVIVLLRTKYRNYRRVIVEKLAKNARVQAATKLKNIMRDSKDVESEVRSRMQPLEDLLRKEIDNLSTVANPTVCAELCHEFWDRTGQDVLRLLEYRKSRPYYKGLRVAISASFCWGFSIGSVAELCATAINIVFLLSLLGHDMVKNEEVEDAQQEVQEIREDSPVAQEEDAAPPPMGFEEALKCIWSEADAKTKLSKDDVTKMCKMVPTFRVIILWLDMLELDPNYYGDDLDELFMYEDQIADWSQSKLNVIIEELPDSPKRPKSSVKIVELPESPKKKALLGIKISEPLGEVPTQGSSAPTLKDIGKGKRKMEVDEYDLDDDDKYFEDNGPYDGESDVDYNPTKGDDEGDENATPETTGVTTNLGTKGDGLVEDDENIFGAVDFDEESIGFECHSNGKGGIVYPEFNPKVDMEKPRFRVKMLFATVQLLRDVVVEQAIKQDAAL
ncbi:uncharacterized protein LOC126801747 [Argentina anserina]|uniref:uncharacterized protein LOC126801747 n=1 Tax=Argentina anserina TaxID=57926 RepID=UPI00217638D9|nr:uncharacterized protein LOC126801747 [Potentilla anserina]